MALLQYDTPFLRIVTVGAEMRLFGPLADWVVDQAADPASPLYGRVDAQRLLVAGHSRGGKLASLMLTSECCVEAGGACSVLQ